jgi:hypothetical protein
MHQSRHGHWRWASLFWQRGQRALWRRTGAGREGVSDGRHVDWCGGGVVGGKVEEYRRLLVI